MSDPSPLGPAREPLLSVENLSVDFHTARGTVHAVRGVSFSIAAGETLAILGESGSGKSVSASAIMGLIDSPGVIDGGRIQYRGEDLLTLDGRRRRALYGNRLAMIFQDPLAALNPVYTVGWQIAETFRIHGVGSTASAERAVALLQRVGIPNAAERARSYPHQLSGGQRQRVMIAIAIAMRPDVLVADEPTSALDVTVQARILMLLKDIQRETNMGLLLITHDLGVAAQVADRVAVMHRGRLVETGPIRQVLELPVHPYTRKLLAAVPGRDLIPRGSENAAEETPLARAEGLSKTYRLNSSIRTGSAGRAIRAVDDVSFSIGRGESVGIVGESGSGKSTLVRLVLGLEPATGGRFLYEGKDIAAYDASQMFLFRRGVQAVFQDPTASLNPYMTVAKIISEPWATHRDVLPKIAWPQRVAELLTMVGLQPDIAGRYPHQFSGGQRQRIAIARSLALDPKLIVCDEAVSALDVSVQAQVIALLKDLRRQLGLSYLFIAHDLGVVRDFCDRVLVMHDGAVVEQGPTAQIFEDPQNSYTRELLAASPVLDLLGGPGARHL